MSQIRSGKVENLPYSLSRWTDVPAAKWSWMLQQFKQGWMTAFDQRTSIPQKWSLKPEDTLGLMFWTKDPSNLVVSQLTLKDYNVKIHVTATGWAEVEKGAPILSESIELLQRTVEAFGAENVTWRFSPVPIVPDAAVRFESLAKGAAMAGLKSVYLSFLQPNDLVPETRAESERAALLQDLARIGFKYDVKVLLCNEDRLLESNRGLHVNLASGVCARPEDFELPNRGVPPAEGCGCVMAVDPFTINESCTFGCSYCYAADKSLTAKKRNTTRNLPVVQ